MWPEFEFLQDPESASISTNWMHIPASAFVHSEMLEANKGNTPSKPEETNSEESTSDEDRPLVQVSLRPFERHHRVFEDAQKNFPAKKSKQPKGGQTVWIQ